MPRPIHFEIPADQPERASAFYRDVFGWQFRKWDGPMPYWLITTGAEGERGIDGGMMPRQAPGASTVNTIGVESIDATLKTIEAKGGRTVVPRMAVPGIGWLAYCVDTEGNTFGVLQPDEKAA
jgi:predicted enzyme related to lactoylglutathione lyase